jgi:HEPN domain-containing protein
MLRAATSAQTLLENGKFRAAYFDNQQCVEKFRKALVA